MDKNKSQNAALEFINDIALIDTELAAKIKPSIDMFMESLENTLSNNELFNQLTEFFKLTDDNAKKQWLMQHQDLATKINEIFDSMNKPSSTLNESEDKTDSKKEEKKVELQNGETKKDGPITNDDLTGDKKEEKKEKKEEKAEEEEEPVEPKGLKLPEDGFKDGKVTMPAKVPGDDKRFMGRSADDLPKPDEIFPPTDPKVVDITKEQTKEVKAPDLTKMKTVIELESVRKIYLDYCKKQNLIKESVEDKYAEFLGQCQFDWALTNIENGTTYKNSPKFVPIRKYATSLYNKFKDEFASYDAALATAKEWYATQGRKRREAEKIVPSNVYVELRKGKDSNFVVNVYLVKTTDLNNTDAEMASDLYSTYTDEFVDDQPAEKIWIKLPKQLRTANGLANVYMIGLSFPKDKKKGVVISRVKHDIVNQIRKDYDKYYVPTTKIPSWVYSQNESLTEAKDVDYKQIYKDLIEQIFQFDHYFAYGDFVDTKAAKAYIMKRLPQKLESYCDVADIDFVEASSALDEKEIEDIVDDFLFSIDTDGLNESESFEFVEDVVDYNDEMQQVIDGLCEEYIDEWLYGKTTEKPVDFVLNRLNKEATLQAKLHDFDADEFINSFTIDELKKMIDAIMDKKWQYKEDLRDAIDHDIEMESLIEGIDDSKPYKNDLFKILYNLYGDYLDAEYKNDSSEKINSTIFIFQNLESAIRKYSEKHNLNADEIIDTFTHDEVLALLKDVKKQIKRDTNDMLASFDWGDVNESLTEGVDYKHDEVDELAREFIDDLLELGDSQWDMDVAEFIEWAWGRGNVPRSEIPYISKRWDVMRTVYRNNIYKK